MKDEFESRAYMQSEISDSTVIRGWNKHELIVWVVTIWSSSMLLIGTVGYCLHG
jgi:hypothetical protein